MTIPYYGSTMLPPLEHTILLYGSTELLREFLIKSFRIFSVLHENFLLLFYCVPGA